MMPPSLISPDEPLAPRNSTAGLAEFFRGAATLDLPTLDPPTLDLRRRLRSATMMPVAGAALAIAIACLVVWTLSSRGFFLGHEPGAAWDYHATQPAPVKHVAAASKPEVDLPQPGYGALPETTRPSTEDLPATPPVKRRSRVRLPLAKPIPSGATAGVISPAKRHHRHLLGLGKLWHWVRHSRSDAKTE
jgi:hypothetical protein